MKERLKIPRNVAKKVAELRDFIDKNKIPANIIFLGKVPQLIPEGEFASMVIDGDVFKGASAIQGALEGYLVELPKFRIWEASNIG